MFRKLLGLKAATTYQYMLENPRAVAATNAAWINIEEHSYLSQDTSSEQAYKTLRGWIANCFETHKKCSKSTVVGLPKRVIEISGQNVFLRETQGIQARYACLSHCWGSKGAALQLTSATIEILKGGISRTRLPKTFSDATTICDRLDIHYIWIDAICGSTHSNVYDSRTHRINRYNARQLRGLD